MFYKLGWMEHFPGAWGHFSVWSSLFLPPTLPPPRMGPHTCCSRPACPPIASPAPDCCPSPGAALWSCRYTWQKHTEEQGQVNTLGSSREESRRHSHLEGRRGPSCTHQSDVIHILERRFCVPCGSGPPISILQLVWCSTQLALLRLKSSHFEVKRLITVWTPSSAIPESQHLFTTLLDQSAGINGLLLCQHPQNEKGDCNKQHLHGWSG